MSASSRHRENTKHPAPHHHAASAPNTPSCDSISATFRCHSLTDITIDTPQSRTNNPNADPDQPSRPNPVHSQSAHTDSQAMSNTARHLSSLKPYSRPITGRFPSLSSDSRPTHRHPKTPRQQPYSATRYHSTPADPAPSPPLVLSRAASQQPY